MSANLPACHQDSPQHAAYVARVEELEAEGCDTSDAQGIADMEFSRLLTQPKKTTKPTHKMKTLTPQEQDEIQNLTYMTPPEDQGQPHDAGQAIWGELAVLRRWDWDDNGGRLSNTRHEYEVYAWEGEDEDPAFQPLTLGKLVAKFIIPTK